MDRTCRTIHKMRFHFSQQKHLSGDRLWKRRGRLRIRSLSARHPCPALGRSNLSPEGNTLRHLSLEHLRTKGTSALLSSRGLPSRKVQDRKSTRLNSSRPSISYAVFCLKKKNVCGPITVLFRLRVLHLRVGRAAYNWLGPCAQPGHDRLD